MFRGAVGSHRRIKRRGRARTSRRSSPLYTSQKSRVKRRWTSIGTPPLADPPARRLGGQQVQRTNPTSVPGNQPHLPALYAQPRNPDRPQVSHRRQDRLAPEIPPSVGLLARQPIPSEEPLSLFGQAALHLAPRGLDAVLFPRLHHHPVQVYNTFRRTRGDPLSTQESEARSPYFFLHSTFNGYVTATAHPPP